MQEELARIKADQAQIVETRNRIMNGGASKEQVFLVINAATTNMTISREVYERNIRITVKFRQIRCRQDALEEKVERLIKKKTLQPPMTKAVPAASVIDYTARKRWKEALYCWIQIFTLKCHEVQLIQHIDLYLITFVWYRFFILQETQKPEK